jgi:hypothetical protein
VVTLRPHNVAVLVLALTATACKDGASGTPTAKKPGAVAAVVRPALAGAAGLELVPKDALYVAAARNPEALLAKLGHAEVVAALKGPYEKAVAEITQETGKNLLDPKAYADWGVDITAPAGFAWVGLQSQAVMFFFSLSDPEKAKTSLYEFGGRVRARFTNEPVGDALRIWPKSDPEVQFLIRGKRGVIIIAEGRHRKTAAVELAKAAAVVTSDASILSQGTFTKAVEAMTYGGDVAGWLNTQRLIHEAMDWGFPARDLGDLTSARALKANAARMMAQTMLAPFGALTMGVDVRDSALDASLTLALLADSLPRQILKNGKGLPPVYATLDGPPMFLLTTVGDPVALWGLIRTLAKVSGEKRSLDFFDGAVREALGVSVDPDIVNLLEGSVGFALSGDLPALMAEKGEPEELLKGALVIGLKAPQKVQDLIAKLAANPMTRGKLVQQGERWIVAVEPKFTITVGVVGGQLVIANDGALLDRLAKGDAKGWLAGLRGERGPLGTPDQNSYGLLDMTAAAGMLIGRSHSWEPPESASPPRLANNAEYQAKRKALRDLRAQQRAEEKAREVADNQRMLSLFETLGRIGARVAMDERGMQLRGGLYVKETVKGASALIAKTIHDEDTTRREGWRREAEHREKMSALREAIRELERPAMKVPMPMPVAGEDELK